RLGANGTLMYQIGGGGGSGGRPVYFPPPGQGAPWVGARRASADGVSLSRGGRKSAIAITKPQGSDEICVAGCALPALRRVVAVPDADCDFPTINPDGSWIAYIRQGRDEKDGAYLVRADGQGTPLRIVKPKVRGQTFLPSDWSPAGDVLLGTMVVEGR